MNSFKLPILALLVSLFSFSIEAQNSTLLIGYIDKEALLEAQPEVQKIEASLILLKTEYEEHYNRMMNEYNEKVKSYISNSKDMLEPIKLARQSEITEREALMSLYRKRYVEDIETQRRNAYAPILKRIDNVIAEVAQEASVSIVFDSKTPLYISTNCIDLLPLVEAKLKE